MGLHRTNHVRERLALALRLTPRQDTQHLQGLGGVVIAEANAPIAHAKPPFVSDALQPGDIALASISKSSEGVENAGRGRPIQSPEASLGTGGQDDRPAHSTSSCRTSSSVRTSARASSSRASCTARRSLSVSGSSSGGASSYARSTGSVVARR